MPRRSLRKFPRRLPAVAATACAGRSRPSYRFARGADDIADEGETTDDERLRGLAAYRAEIDRIRARRVAPPTPPLPGSRRRFVTMACRRSSFAISSTPSRRMSSRSATPTTPNCSTTAAARQTRSAGCSSHLVGRASEENLRRSDCICSALQLVNFWQDVAVDWQEGSRLSTAGRPRPLWRRRGGHRGGPLLGRMARADRLRGLAHARPECLPARRSVHEPARAARLGNPADGAGPACAYSKRSAPRTATYSGSAPCYGKADWLGLGARALFMSPMHSV